jgi:hypothetical protein
MISPLRTISILALTIVIFIILAIPASATDTGFLVRSDPAGAYACIDTYTCNATPANFAAEPGSQHTITVYKKDYLRWSRAVRIGSGGITDINAQLVSGAPAFGYLHHTNTFNADVYIDGTYYGNGEQIVLLPVGNHTVLLTKPGHDDSEFVLEILPGQVVYTNYGVGSSKKGMDLGTISVSSQPTGGAVYVNNDFKGTTDTSSKIKVQLAPGTYPVRVTLPYYGEYIGNVTIEAGTTKDLRAMLVPASFTTASADTGMISVTSIPSGANIYLDREYMGITPMVIPKVAAGPHVIMLHLYGYQYWSGPANVTAGDCTQVRATLAPPGYPFTSGFEKSTLPTPNPTKSDLPSVIPLAGVGICGAFVLLTRKSG